MIEPTDEMVEAAQAATCRAESDECMAQALRAALAIVARDYELLPYCNNELLPGVVCKLSAQLGHEEHRARMPGGNPVRWS